jgi:dedicated sortase system histidine kinase
MSLRKQLAILSLLSLVLPWAGYRYVREMESVLRDGLERSLVERAQTVAGALERQSWTRELSNSAASRYASADVYVRTLAAAPVIDGSRADWSIDQSLSLELSDSVRYWIGTFGSFLYVLLDVDDDAVVFQARPGEPPYGDRVVVLLGEDTPLWRVLATAAPGRVRAQQTAMPLLAASGRYDDRIQAAWLATRSGYSLELRVPLGMTGGAIGLAVVDVDPGAVGAGSAAAAGFGVDLATSWNTDSQPSPGRIVSQSAVLSGALQPFADASNRYSVIDTAGWIRSSAGSIDGDAGTAAARSFTGDLLQFFLQTDDPDYTGVESPPGRIADETLRAVADTSVVSWYRGDFDNSSRVVAGVPLHHEDQRVGTLLLEQASESVLTATNQAVLRLLSTTFLASAVAMIGMIGFATYLSVRVSRLARAAGYALGPRGQIDTTLPGRGARDEIGALARSFERLLERLNEYTNYLRTLTSKLSHELRTPLAVVSTSLDNLEQAGEDDAKQYLLRLRDGADRLDAILGSMSEATRMEQAIRDASVSTFDAVAVTQSCAKAYADIYADYQILCTGLTSSQFVRGSPELLAQLLDKLVDNAASFSAPGGPIEIALTKRDDALELVIANKGPLLPPQMREQLFDSLVSVRADGGEKPHLGLGLFVARLIAEFHGGRIDAQNLADGSGVAFKISLPVVAQPAAVPSEMPGAGR